MQTKTTIPTDWKLVKLGEVIRLEYGKPLPDSKRKLDGAYPVYGANGEKMRTDEYYYDKKSITVGRKGSVGELNLTSEKFWPLDVTYYVVFESKKCDLMFLYELLRTLNLPKLAAGVKPGLNRNEVYSIDAKIPPLPEQQKIVEVLEAWDSYLEKLTKAIELKRKLKSGLMQVLLTGKIRLKGFRDPWNKVKLGEISQIISGGTPSTKIESYWNGNIPWVSSSDLIIDNVRFVNVHRYISTEAVKNSATKIIPEQSILVVSRVGVGKIAVNLMPICTSQDFQSIINHKGHFNPFFLANLLSIEIQQFLQINQGSFIKGFLKSDLENMTIKLPSVEEQTAIANILTTADRDIEVLEKKKMLVEQQKKFLLNNLITGKIRLPEFIH